MLLPGLGYRATLPEVLRRARTLYDDREFIVTRDQRRTFGDIDRDWLALARQLLDAGVGKGMRIGLHLPSGPEFAVAWTAAGRIGAMVMPFSTLYRPSELNKALVAGDVHLLISATVMFEQDHQTFLESAVPGLATSSELIRCPDVPFLRSVWLFGEPDRSWAKGINLSSGEAGVTEALLRQAEDEVTPADHFLVVFTSGSTAEPKAVVHTQGAVIGKTALPISTGGLPPPGSHVFAGVPFFWVGGVLALGGALQGGATLVTQERFETQGALDLIEAEKTLVVLAWPSLIARMRADPSVERRDLSATPQLNGSLEGYGTGERHQSFGMTETMGFYSAGPRSDAPPEERGRLPERLRGSFGAIVSGYEVKVVDPRTGVELEEEGIGELLVRGRFLMDGLYKQERQDVFDEGGWYHTGDRGYMRSGYLFFVGRSGDTIKTHGANVSVQEVELALETHPAVVSASVLGVSNQSEDDQVVVAAVAMTENADVSVEEVRTYAAERLSSYKVPRTIIEIPSEQLPLLATGKIDKQALRVDLLRRIEPLLGPDD